MFLFIYFHIIEVHNELQRVYRAFVPGVCTGRLYWRSYRRAYQAFVAGVCTAECSANKIPNRLHNFHSNTSQPLSYREEHSFYYRHLSWSLGLHRSVVSFCLDSIQLQTITKSWNLVLQCVTSFINFQVLQFYTFTALNGFCFTQKISKFQVNKERANAVLFNSKYLLCTAKS